MVVIMLSKKLFMIANAIVIAYVLFVAVMTILDDSKIWKKVVALVVALAAGWLMFQRDTYLPFLGEAVFPASAIVDARVPEGANAELVLNVNAPDGTKIIYWGAEQHKDVIGNPWDAYGKYTNMGVATVTGGKAVVKFKCPAEYKVAMGQKKLKRHIHYRTCCTMNAMMGPIETAYVNC